jgi:large subunit ribosomal protein L10
MSKQIKQMQMDTLKQTLQGVRDLVVLSASGVDAQADNHMRLGLRKKKIHMQLVKNSLAQRVFTELGLKSDSCWEGPTTLAWGADSLKDLSREIEAQTKRIKQLKIKGALSEGLAIPFEQALTMPSRQEALARVIGLVLSPAARIASLLQSPGARLASQIKELSEKKAEAPPAEAEAPAAPAS